MGVSFEIHVLHDGSSDLRSHNDHYRSTNRIDGVSNNASSNGNTNNLADIRSNICVTHTI